MIQENNMMSVASTVAKLSSADKTVADHSNARIRLSIYLQACTPALLPFVILWSLVYLVGLFVVMPRNSLNQTWLETGNTLAHISYSGPPFHQRGCENAGNLVSGARPPTLFLLLKNHTPIHAEQTDTSQPNDIFTDRVPHLIFCPCIYVH
mmetsp:Transcript_18274/g.42301  ORF Transcript_18274/g.42301 Transcript_18274/m.42301 type:complete len:151 (-) Transcript_18274:44-496(-)